MKWNPDFSGWTPEAIRRIKENPNAHFVSPAEVQVLRDLTFHSVSLIPHDQLLDKSIPPVEVIKGASGR